MYTETSRRRMESDIREINKCLEEKDIAKARNLLTIMMRTYDGTILSLNTAMLPTESAIYGKNFDELKNYDNNIYSNLTIIRNKLELYDLQYNRDTDKVNPVSRAGISSVVEIINAVQRLEGISDKDKSQVKDKVIAIGDILSSDMDRVSRWIALKPTIEWLSGVDAEVGFLILTLIAKSV